MMEQKSMRNPANAPEKVVATQGRIPMSVPQQKLQVPDIPGYHLHWMLGNPQRIQQALRAGYEFVSPEDVNIINTGIADNLGESGNSDLGSRVSVPAGMNDLGADNQPQQLYLMKIRQEWWDEDQQLIEQRNMQVAEALRGGQDTGANPHGAENRYVPERAKKAMADLFIPKTRRP